jgi:hypothetical protein
MYSVIIDSQYRSPHPSSITHTVCFEMASKAKLNVQNFPRPPLLELTARHLVIRWKGQTLAETRSAYWVLETTHPPSRSMMESWGSR